ncbi:MAG: hypothetical protein KF760_15620 [Candidatus Eremiobacteraeota bacterium]|nr:hypothetical protein [Candidatus Eremiobacteraeota bacterium]MCW5869293.1 hypothetical protein [Candidatus Eremiobacteraeota bacterium]
MEISDFNVGLGATKQGVDWGWLQSRVRLSRLGHPAEQVQNRLTEMLFGTKLSQREKLEYRVKLAEALDIIDDLDQGVTPSQVVPVGRRTTSTGSISWKPSISQGEPYAATPEQVFHRRKLLRIHDFLAREGEVCFHRIAVKVSSRQGERKAGFDQVFLNPEGLREITHPTQPAVVHLRLPQRCLKQVDVLRVARSGKKVQASSG